MATPCTYICTKYMKGLHLKQYARLIYRGEYVGFSVPCRWHHYWGPSEVPPSAEYRMGTCEITYFTSNYGVKIEFSVTRKTCVALPDAGWNPS
jgi:hypothetical protein